MCRANVNATAVLAFLHRVLDVFKHYFSELEEESLRDNFVIAYELLDEVGVSSLRHCICICLLACPSPKIDWCSSAA